MARRLSPWAFWDTLSLVLVVSGCLDMMAGLILLVISPTIGWFQGLVLTALGLVGYCVGRFGIWLTAKLQPVRTVSKVQSPQRTLFLVTRPSPTLYPASPTGAFQQFSEHFKEPS